MRSSLFLVSKINTTKIRESQQPQILIVVELRSYLVFPTTETESETTTRWHQQTFFYTTSGRGWADPPSLLLPFARLAPWRDKIVKVTVGANRAKSSTWVEERAKKEAVGKEMKNLIKNRVHSSASSAAVPRLWERLAFSHSCRPPPNLFYAIQFRSRIYHRRVP